MAQDQADASLSHRRNYRFHNVTNNCLIGSTAAIAFMIP